MNHPLPTRTVERRQPQQGAVAVMVALSLAVLIGAAGLAIDGGRLYITKSELQTGADACALAASRRLLNCAAADMSCLIAAENAGIAAAALNKASMQSAAVTLQAANISFKKLLTDPSWATRTGGATGDSRYVRCQPSVSGITPWLMGVVGAGSSTVSAQAAATLAGAQTFSVGPIGICKPATAWTVGQWITGTANSLGNSIRWVDLDGGTSSNAEVNAQLASTSVVPNIKIGSTISISNTALNSVRGGYNTRFGIYANGGGYNATSNPPDYTGYAYPSKNPGGIALNTSAFNDYLSNRATNTAFIASKFNGVWNLNPSAYTLATSAQYQGNNARRLINVPVLDTCATNTTAKVVGLACVLLLNPIDSGSGAQIHLEYRGDSLAGTSSCPITPVTGVPTSLTGAGGYTVPALVQ